MSNFWGLIKAYWWSNRWKEAWGLTLAIALLTAASSKTGVWIAEASGDLVNSIASFHDHDNARPLATLLTSAGTLVLLVLVKDAAIIGVRHFFSTTLHRKWRGWLNGVFNQFLLDGNHTHFHVQHGVGGTGGAAAMPDNIDQRVQESIKAMCGGAIGLAMGILGVSTSLLFVGSELIDTSTSVRGLDFLGSYGTAVLALVAVAAYVPINTFVAIKMGAVLERLNVAIQSTEGSYRAELTMLLRRSFQVAASRAEPVHRRVHDRLYEDVDGVWSRLNRIDASYLSFSLVYNFLAAKVVAYLPGLPAYVNYKIGLRDYVTGAELVSALISECSWFIQVMPAIANLKANAKRITDLAAAIDRVQKPRDFYRRTGRSDFRYDTQDPNFGLTVQHLELMADGDGEPFLRAASLRFLPGEWSFVRGPSGCGKTSLLKAINGLWAYGAGQIVFPEGVRPFYAAQEIKLPHIALKQLVAMPDNAEDYSEARVAAALYRARMGQFIEHLDEEGHAGKPWDQVFSGGQKQKLVLARILLHRPGLLFLDEATAALDPEAKLHFHQAIREGCPNAIVISVMHDPTPPKSARGEEFYDTILDIENGVATRIDRMPKRRRQRVLAPLNFSG